MPILILILSIIASCANGQNQKSKIMLKDKIMPNEYGQAILFYTDKADEGATVIEVLKNSKKIMEDYILSIPNDKMDYQYSYGKWTVAEVIQHIISYEIIMTERALVVAGVNKSAATFNFYTQSITVKGAKGKTKEKLLEEFLGVREKTMQAFKSLTIEQLKIVGTLDGNKASVRMIGLCISGHQTHHFDVLRNRYGLL